MFGFPILYFMFENRVKWQIYFSVKVSSWVFQFFFFLLSKSLASQWCSVLSCQWLGPDLLNWSTVHKANEANNDPHSYECNFFSNCIEKHEKFRTFNGVWTWTSQCWCDTLTNWAMKLLMLEAGHLRVQMFLCWMSQWTKWYMKWIIYWSELRIWNQMKLWSLQLWMHFSAIV